MLDQHDRGLICHLLVDPETSILIEYTYKQAGKR
jgi:hypothetical protein